MTWPTATLSAPNLTSIRASAWQGASYACLCPNTVVWSSTLAATATGDTNASISYGSTITGNAANVQIGHRVLIGTVNDVRQATFSGRVRTAPAAGSMGINETSAALNSGMYLWVVDDYPLLDKLARPVGDPPVQYKDYDLTYQGLKPVAVGLQLGYAGFINASNVLRIAFDVSNSYAAESGASISSYLFTFTAATYTVISGSLSTATVTVDFNEGFQWGKLVVTDSGGRTQTRHFMIFACGSSTTPALSFQGATISANLNEGWTATTSAFADVSIVLDNTPVVLFTQEWYAGIEGPINNNIDMVGWLRTETDPAQTDPTYSLIASSQFEITGVGSKLARLEAQLLALSYVASPTVWDEIKNLTPWRGIVHFLQRHTTLLELVDLTFDSTSDTFLFPFLTTQGGNVLAAVNGIANQINASMEFAPDGAARVVRDARFLSLSARSALLTYANWTAQDYSDPQGLSLQYTHENTLGKVDADGAFYNSSSSDAIAFRCRAPGLAQDAGQDTVNLNNQVLAAGSDANVAQTELNQRAGDMFEISREPSYKLATSQADGYHFLIPSKQVWYTWTLTAGTDDIRGISYSSSQRWLLLDSSITIDNDHGTRTVQLNYNLETPVGNPATTIIIPAPGSIDLSIPAFPPFDPFPMFPDLGIIDGIDAGDMPPYVGTGLTGVPGHHIVAPRDGNSVVIWTATQVWTSRSFAARAVPVWTEITPSDLGSFQVYDVRFDPTTGTNSTGCYILASDGVNSAVWHTADVFNGPVAWTSGNVLGNVYKVLCPSQSAGKILAYSPGGGGGGGSGAWSFDFDFSISPYVFYADPGLGGYGAWTNSRWESTTTAGPSQHLLPRIDFGNMPHVTSIEVFYTRQTGVQGSDSEVYGLPGYTNDSALNGAVGTYHDTFSVNLTTRTGLVFALDSGTPDGPVNYINRIILSGPDTPPTLSGSALVGYSADYGATWSTVTVGASPGSIGGFDLNKIGTASLAAADQAAEKATTLGGAYSAATGGGVTGAEPLTLYVPRFKFGGTTTNANLASPDFVLTASALVSSESFWKVSGGTPTAMTPSHGGTAGLAFSAFGICMSYLNGKIIAYLAKVSGTAYLFTTTSGTAWTDRGSLSGALAVRIRRSDLRAAPALFIAGGTILKYSKDFGATLSDRTKPINSGLLGIEVYG